MSRAAVASIRLKCCGCRVSSARNPLTMLPIMSESALQPAQDPSSGSAKRARRNELPQLFVAMSAGPNCTSIFHGLLMVPNVEKLKLSARTRPQYNKWLEEGFAAGTEKYCVWSVGTTSAFNEGPLTLDQTELRQVHGPVCEILPQASRAKLLALRVSVGGENVAVSDLLRRQRLRAWRTHSAGHAMEVLGGSLSDLVTPVSYIKKAGVQFPCGENIVLQGEVVDEGKVTAQRASSSESE